MIIMDRWLYSPGDYKHSILETLQNSEVLWPQLLQDTNNLIHRKKHLKTQFLALKE